MTPSLEKILAEINTLTAAERRHLRDLLEREQNAQGPAPTVSRVNEVKGKYAFVATSSEAFADRKAEEIELEDRRAYRP